MKLLGYWVFFPALLMETLIRSDISNLPLTGIAFTMIASFMTMAIALLVSRRFIMHVFRTFRAILFVSISIGHALEWFHRPSRARQALWR